MLTPLSQLYAYEAAGCDVHAAHQLLLHKRLERLATQAQQLRKAESKSDITAIGGAQSNEESERAWDSRGDDAPKERLRGDISTNSV